MTSETTVILNPAAGWPFPKEQTMEAQTQEAKTTKARGRKGADKQEAAREDSVLRELSTELVKLKKSADDEAESYSDAVKAAAEKTGYHASTIRSVVAALASEDFEEKHRKVEQLQLAFEALA